MRKILQFYRMKLKIITDFLKFEGGIYIYTGPQPNPVTATKFLHGYEESDSFLLKELKDLYKLLDKQISEKLAVAQKNGKKILIALGENHKNRKSLLVELLILQLAKKHEIKILACELDPESLPLPLALPLNPNNLNLSFIPIIGSRSST